MYTSHCQCVCAIRMQKYTLLHKVSSLCFLPSRLTARPPQNLHSSIWIRGLPNPNFKVKNECIPYAFCQCVAQSKSLFCLAKCLHFATCKAFVLRVDAESCISVSGSEALSTPISKTSRSVLHIAPLSMHGAKQERLCLTKCLHIAFPQAFFFSSRQKAAFQILGQGPCRTLFTRQ